MTQAKSCIDRLNDFVELNRITRTELAQKLGSSQPSISAILSGKRSLSRGMIARIGEKYPELDIDWLLTGEGEMLKGTPASDILTSTEMKDIPLVPLYSLTAVAGFGKGTDSSEEVEGLIPWVSAHVGDFAIHITGHSMEPIIPHGSDVLVRPYDFIDYSALEFGRVHVVVTEDERAMIKVLKRDKENPGHLLLISYNDEYPELSIPITSIRRVFLAVSVQAPL